MQAAQASSLGERMLARGVPKNAVVLPFASSESIAAFARKHTESGSSASEKAMALYQAILKLKSRGAIEADKVNEPKARAPKTASELMTLALEPDAERNREAGCYELSALYVAAARAVGLQAKGAARRRPVGTGQIGHIAAAVRADADAPWRIYDLQNERRRTHGFRILDDLSFAAHHYNHLAVSAHLRGAPRKALRYVDWAVSLAPEEPSMANNRAIILASLGELDGAVAEAAGAVAMAPRVPVYRYQLGRLQMQVGRLQAAVASLRAARQLETGYPLATRDLGWALLLLGQDTRALRLLQRAQRRRAPDATLYLALAQMVTGDRAAARETLSGAAKKSTPSLRALTALLESDATGAGKAGALHNDNDSVARLRRLLAQTRERRTRAAVRD